MEQIAAIYCRLSKDDGTIEESSSIQSQKDSLTKYCKEHSFEIYKIYCDDGYTGTNDQRPAFQEMISDAERGRFNIIITKDLSRLSRNYLIAGKYMEEVFPSLKIRYIAVNDYYDSNNDNNEFAPFKNIINEWYSKDISKKIKFTFRNMQKQGRIPGGDVPLYGYMYDENRNRIPDPETAPVVKYIFEAFLKCGSSKHVLRTLRERKIINPGYYNYLKYGTNPKKYANCSDELKTNWTQSRMSRILRNVEYTGTLILNKYVAPRIGQRATMRVSDEERIVHENRFEGLISKEVFDKANRMLDINKNATTPLEENKYRGLLMCAYCGRPMAYHKLKDKYYYYCRYEDCGHPYSVSKKLIESVIKDELTALKEYVIAHEDAIREYAASYYEKHKKKNNNPNDKEIEQLKAKCLQIDKYIQKLFEANVRGDLPQSTYEMMMKKYKIEKEDIEGKISLLKPSQKEEDIDYVISTNEFIKFVKELNVDGDFDMELLRKIILYINVYSKSKRSGEKKEFEIHYCDFGIMEDFAYERINKQ